MRRQNCRCEIGRALLSPVGRRALILVCLGAAWIALTSGALARESARSAPGRPLSGKSLSRFLFPSTTENADMPEEPAEPPPAATTVAAQQPAAVWLQQPGFVAPNGTSTTVPAGFTATAPSSAGQASNAVNPANGSTASKSRRNNPPAGGLRSLWQSFLGTNAAAPPATTANSNRQPLPSQYPLPNINAAVPATATASAGKVAESLFGQVAGVQAASPPAMSPSTTSPAAASQLAKSTPVTIPPAKPNEQQLARRLPEARQAASEEAKSAPLVLATATMTEARTKSSAGSDVNAAPRYATTSAPAAVYPPGTIPPPTALGQIPQAFANSTQEGGSLAALWQPMSMASNGPALPKPSDRLVAAAATQAPANTDAAGFASLLMRPLQMTNGNPAAASSGAPSSAGIAANDRQSTIKESVQSSSLFHQLSMNVNGEAYSPQEAVSESAAGSRLLRDEEVVAGGANVAASKILQTAATEEKGAKGDRELVALMQELAPEPADLSTETGELVPEAMPEPGADGAAGAKKDDTLEGAEKLGEAPVDRTLDFLRAETVLLKPGESQCDVGIAYIFTDNDFPILLTDGGGNIVSVTDVRFLVRELTVPLEYRVGLHKRVQGFLNMPVGWSNTQVTVASQEDFRNDGGIGDLTFGLTIQCVEATANCPYVITTISGTAPTGGDPFTGIVGISPTAPSLGDGFWSVQGTVLFIQEYDPVVLFYGLGMERSFPHEYIGIDFEPGAQYSYLLGVGFAVNERITLSTRFFGSYVEELEANGARVLGTNTEPMTIRMSATISKPCNRLVEPFVEFGITEASVNSNVGITWTF